MATDSDGFQLKMDFLPVDFYEKIALNIDAEFFPAASALSGIIGVVSSEFLVKRAIHPIYIEDGYIAKKEFLSYYKRKNGEYVPIATTSRKYLQYTKVELEAYSAVYSTDPEVTQLHTFCTRSNVVLLLFSSSLSKEIVKFVDLIPVISVLYINTAVTERIDAIVKKIVEKKTLNRLNIGSEHHFNAATTTTLLDLLKQEQFDHAYVCEACDLPMESLIAEWRENSAKMTGKRVLCKTVTVKNPIADFGFEACSEEEIDNLYRYYVYLRTRRAAKVFIMRNDEGRAIYVLEDSKMPMQNAIVFT